MPSFPIATRQSTEPEVNLYPKLLCEKNSTLFQQVLDDEVADRIFKKIKEETPWQRMSHLGGHVPRLVAVQGEIADDGSTPIYRHPGDELPILMPFSPTVQYVRNHVQIRLGHTVNHVLIQYYRDGSDSISEHSDKTLDIIPNTFIGNFSLGAQRTLIFRTKKSDGEGRGPTMSYIQSRQVCRVALPHNSLLVMGLSTNKRWLHSIRPDKRLEIMKTEEELAFSGGRISMTFRMIGTFVDKDQKRVWGQGAVAKIQSDARVVHNIKTMEFEHMIQAFSKENHDPNFDWELHYSSGFDVVNIANAQKVSSRLMSS